jgi:thioredoxin reductase (NADPH)
MTAAVDVLIVGAGPAGLAAAIAASRLGLSAVVLEKGALVNSLWHYPTHMVFFTTPELLEIGGLPFVSPYEKPTRQEALRYYRRVLDTFHLDVVLGERVETIAPDGNVGEAGDGGFVVRSTSPLGDARTRHARAVVIATGAYDVPNLIGVPGEDLPHVSHYYREPHGYYRQRVVIVGGKNSAAEAALEIYRNGGRVLLVHRGAALGESIKYWVKPDIENRIKEGSIDARLLTRVEEIQPGRVKLSGPDGEDWEPADAVLLMTGYRSENVLLEQAGVAIDPDTGGPAHDPATFETTVPNLFVAGAVVAGRQSGRIFIENGRFHGEVVVEEISKRQKSEGRKQK